MARLVTGTPVGPGNRLTAAPIQPIAVPLWLGAERPGVDSAPAALAAGLRRRWTDGGRPGLLARLAPAATIPITTPADASERLHRRTLAFLPEVGAACGLLADEVAAAIGAGALAVSLGGDHALSIGSIAGAARAAAPGRLGVLYLDTHPNLNTPETSPSGHLHGMALAAALGLGGPGLAGLAALGPAVRSEDVCLLGVRDLDQSERRIIRERGVWALTMEEWSDAGLRHGLAAALAHLEGRNLAAVHLSFDLDVLDPTLLPRTGPAIVGGLTYREASGVLRRLRARDGPIRSVDWVELNPGLDPTARSTRTAVALWGRCSGRRCGRARTSTSTTTTTNAPATTMAGLDRPSGPRDVRPTRRPRCRDR